MSEYVCCDFDLAEGIDCRELEQIVRCRDCKYATDDGYGCTLFGRREQVGNYRWEDVTAEVEPDGYCAWGERRDA